MRRNPEFRGCAAAGAAQAVGALAVALLASPSCAHKVKVDPIKFEPIDITLRIHLEADEKLRSFFEDSAAPAPTPPAAEPGAGGHEGATP